MQSNANIDANMLLCCRVMFLQSVVKVVEEKTMTHPAIAVAEPEKVVEATIEKTQKTINKLVDQGQLDEKKLEIFQNFLSNL